MCVGVCECVCACVCVCVGVWVWACVCVCGGGAGQLFERFIPSVNDFFFSPSISSSYFFSSVGWFTWTERHTYIIICTVRILAELLVQNGICDTWLQIQPRKEGRKEGTVVVDYM